MKKKLKIKLAVPDRHTAYHKVTWLGHMTYFACCFVEAHGVYAMAAGGMFGLGLLGVFIHESEV